MRAQWVCPRAENGAKWYKSDHQQQTSMSLLQTVKSISGGKSRQERVDGRHPPSKNALDMPEWRETTEQTGRNSRQPSQVVCISEDLNLSVEELETLPAGTSQGHTIDRLEKRGTENSTTFFERTREGDCQSGERWNYFKGNADVTSERKRSAAHMGFFPAPRYPLEL